MENPRVENSSETGRNKMYSIENVMSFKNKIPQMITVSTCVHYFWLSANWIWNQPRNMPLGRTLGVFPGKFD